MIYKFLLFILIRLNSSNHQPYLWKTVSIMTENKGFLQLCCMAHEIFYSEDFFSDDDSVHLPSSLTFPQLSFMPHSGPDLTSDFTSSFQVEKSVQCDSQSSVSILALSNMPSICTDHSAKIITPSCKSFSISHTAKVALIHPSTQFFCKICNQCFKSGQALGGHLSKNH